MGRLELAEGGLVRRFETAVLRADSDRLNGVEDRDVLSVVAPVAARSLADDDWSGSGASRVAFVARRFAERKVPS